MRYLNDSNSIQINFLLMNKKYKHQKKIFKLNMCSSFVHLFINYIFQLFERLLAEAPDIIDRKVKILDGDMSLINLGLSQEAMEVWSVYIFL